MPYRDVKGSETLFNKTNKNDRYKQMSKQQQLIEEKKREIQEKQKKKITEETVDVKSDRPPLKFSNDGSFLDQFKKLSSMPGFQITKSDNTSSTENKTDDPDAPDQNKKEGEEKPNEVTTAANNTALLVNQPQQQPRPQQQLPPQQLQFQQLQPHQQPPPPPPDPRYSAPHPAYFPPQNYQPPQFLPFGVPPPPPPVPPPNTNPQAVNAQGVPPPPMPPCFPPIPPPFQGPPQTGLPLTNLLAPPPPPPPPPSKYSPQVPPENVQQGNMALPPHGRPDCFPQMQHPEPCPPPSNNNQWFQQRSSENPDNTNPMMGEEDGPNYDIPPLMRDQNTHMSPFRRDQNHHHPPGMRDRNNSSHNIPPLLRDRPNMNHNIPPLMGDRNYPNRMRDRNNSDRNIPPLMRDPKNIPPLMPEMNYRNDRSPPYRNDRSPPYRNDRSPPYRNDRSPPFRNDRSPPYRNDRSPPYRNDRSPPYRNDRSPSYRNDRSPPFRNDRSPPYRNDRSPPYRNDRNSSRNNNNSFRRDQRSPNRNMPSFRNDRNNTNQKPPFKRDQNEDSQFGVNHDDGSSSPNQPSHLLNDQNNPNIPTFRNENENIPTVKEESSSSNPPIQQETPPEIKKEESTDQKSQRSERKRKSRWSDDKEVDIKPPATIEVVATVPKINVTGMHGHMLTKVTRTDPGLLQYALTAYGSTYLSEEDWKKAEENYKVHLLYQDMMAKRAEVEKLKQAGKNKYEYDSDEEIDEKGTWEHKLRDKEMAATQQWAESLTEMAKGKHHIGDFLPPDELKKFMAKYQAVKGGPEEREPDLSDYKEYKLGEENKGFQMLQKLGWSEGQGLGSDGGGIVDPINKGQLREFKEGLGHSRPDDVSDGDDEYDAYRKRMMLAYRFRPNPLNNPRRPYY